MPRWPGSGTAWSTTTPGGWVDQRCTYVAIGPEGVAIHEYISAKLTIVIPAKNESRLLPTLLESLCRQDYSPDETTKVMWPMPVRLTAHRNWPCLLPAGSISK